MQTVHSSTNSTPWGVYSPWPCCHHLMELFRHISNHYPSRYLFTPWSRECAHAGEMPCSLTQCPTMPTAVETCIPRTSQSSVTGHSHCAMMPCMYKEHIYIQIRDAEGGRCQWTCSHHEWFFYIPLEVSEMALLFMWLCKPWGIYSLQCWRVRNKSPQACPAMGLEPKPTVWQVCTHELWYYTFPSCESSLLGTQSSLGKTIQELNMQTNYQRATVCFYLCSFVIHLHSAYGLRWLDSVLTIHLQNLMYMSVQETSNDRKGSGQ